MTMSNDPDEEFLVRVGISLLAARRYYDDGHPEHHRLALILLDGAAESLLRRLVNENEMWFSFGELMAGQNAEAATLGLDQPHVVHDMTFPSDLVSEGAYGEPVHLSRTQRRKLDKEFGPNADVAVFFRRLSRDEAKALKHLEAPQV